MADNLSQDLHGQMIAPAKINLTLSVGAPFSGGPLAGYHPLKSLVMFAPACADMVDGALTYGDITLVCDGPYGQDRRLVGDNFVLRAAHVLKKASGTKMGAALKLEKNLPIASGIGGGSADCAAALQLLNKLWGLNWPIEQLAGLAMDEGLGADVPACLYSTALIMGGIGEEIMPLPKGGCLSALLVNSGVSCPTGPVFKAYDGGKIAPLADHSEAIKSAWHNGPLLEQCRAIGNDLAVPAQSICPEIAQTLAALNGLAGPDDLVGLSGSGATCFWIKQGNHGLKSDYSAALSHLGPNIWVGISPLI